MLFCSALKLEGIDTFLEAFDRYTICPEYADTFGAKVYKISRDAQGMRLTHLKVTGGSLRVKMVLKEEEKVDQIRIYSGSSYRTTEEVEAGRICVITGPDTTRAGEGLGAESEAAAPMLTPVLNYQIDCRRAVMSWYVFKVKTVGRRDSGAAYCLGQTIK